MYSYQELYPWEKPGIYRNEGMGRGGDAAVRGKSPQISKCLIDSFGTRR